MSLLVGGAHSVGGNRSGVGDEQRVEVFSQGRLAASVASEDADELARRYMRVDSGEDKPVSIVVNSTLVQVIMGFVLSFCSAR